MAKDLFIRARLPDAPTKLKIESYAKEHYGSTAKMIRALIVRELATQDIHVDLTMPEWGGRRPYGKEDE